MQTDLAIVTETWLTSGPTLDEDIEDLREGSGLGLMVRNRDPGARGHSHGGVGIVFRQSTCNFKELSFDNPERYEVIVALGTIPGHSRKMLVIACYLPPGDNAQRGNGCLDYIEDLIIRLKRKYSDPYLVIGGDFNQWKIHDVVANFPEILEAQVGPTRGSRCLDRIFSNLDVTSAGSVPPLETDSEGESRRSDHRIAFLEAQLERVRKFEWITYQYRLFNEESEKLFGEWVINNDWSSVTSVAGSNNKANAYQGEVTDALDRFFPLKTTRKKSTDLPWINAGIRRRLAQRLSLIHI